MYKEMGLNSSRKLQINFILTSNKFN